MLGYRVSCTNTSRFLGSKPSGRKLISSGSDGPPLRDRPAASPEWRAGTACISVGRTEVVAGTILHQDTAFGCSWFPAAGTQFACETHAVYRPSRQLFEVVQIKASAIVLGGRRDPAQSSRVRTASCSCYPGLDTPP